VRERIVPASYSDLGPDLDADPSTPDFDLDRAATDGDTDGGSVEYPDPDGNPDGNAYAIQHADADNRADADHDADADHRTNPDQNADADFDAEPHAGTTDENGDGNAYVTERSNRAGLSDSAGSSELPVYDPARFRGVCAEPVV
jgi:hypothetical protein